jgi:hypothetical protein
MYKVTFSRLYKDGNEWKDSAGFGPDELLKLAKAANEAHTWICDHKRRGTSEE